MTATEKITLLVGELIYTEIDDVNSVDYTQDKNEYTAISVFMENGNRYIVDIKQC